MLFRRLCRFRLFPMTLHRFWVLVISLAFINFILFSYNVILEEEYQSYVRSKQTTGVAAWAQPNSQGSKKTVRSSGFSLAAGVLERCRHLTKPYIFNVRSSAWTQRMHLTRDNTSLYCPVEKVGTTFWRRIIYQTIFPGMFRHPYQVSIYSALTQTFVSPGKEVTRDSFKKYFSFLFVRDPFHRILSAYIDKIFVPNPQFWDKIGKHSIQMFRQNDSRTCYHDATFSEFVQHVVWSIRRIRHLDPHVLPATEMCIPCSLEYSFVGKMESFSTDLYPVLEKLQLDSVTAIPETELKRMSDLDAIIDSISSPFSWRDNILRCMDWNEALQRVWRKLQMRGLIEMNKKFPLNKTAAEHIQKWDFLKIAKRSWITSDPMKLKQQRKDVLIELYRTVPLQVLHEFVHTNIADFYLFDYSPYPGEVFNRTTDFKEKHFVDFRT